MRLLLLIFMILLLAVTVNAENYRYSIGFSGGLMQLSGSSVFDYEADAEYGFIFGHRLGEGWRLSLDYTTFNLDDSLGTLEGDYGELTSNLKVEYSATRVGLLINREYLNLSPWLSFDAGLGGGALFWKISDRDLNTTYKVPAEKGGNTDLATTELILTAATGMRVFPVSMISLNVDARADYLTGAGAEFSQTVKDALDDWMFSVSASVNFYFDRVREPIAWRSDTAWQHSYPPPLRTGLTLDSDQDGVPNEYDHCLNSPPGIAVDKFGCPLDSDADGVPDGLDDCPQSSPYAFGLVDIHGCEVDADFDGVPDYVDACPYNRIGAIVDAKGCPLDSDGDGVPDGLDDCPGTMYGLEVDQYGCIDLSVFDAPMVLNIDYPSGSFEVDPHSKKKLEKLANILNFAPFIKLEINGYTDNIGTSSANQKLSEKRAARVRDFLVTLGVASERIKVFGRGETNFTASNQTAEGRAKNRRIEILFYK